MTNGEVFSDHSIQAVIHIGRHSREAPFNSRRAGHAGIALQQRSGSSILTLASAFCRSMDARVRGHDVEKWFRSSLTLPCPCMRKAHLRERYRSSKRDVIPAYAGIHCAASSAQHPGTCSKALSLLEKATRPQITHHLTRSRTQFPPDFPQSTPGISAPFKKLHAITQKISSPPQKSGATLRRLNQQKQPFLRTLKK